MLLGMDMPSAGRSVRRGLLSLRREKRWGTVLVMLCLAMTLLQMLIAGLSALKGIESLFTAKSGIHLEVANGTADQDIQDLYGALSELPYVESVEYVPKEKAYEREKLRDPALVASLEKFAVQNPFPDTFAVTLSSLDAFGNLRTFVEQGKWKGIVDPSFLASVSTQEREVQSYLSVSRSVTRLAYIVLWIGIAALAGIILDIAVQRAYARKEELELETVLGASRLQVILPLASEIAALLLGALVVGFALTTIFLVLLPSLIPALAAGGEFAEARSYTVPLLVFVFPLAALAEALLLLAASLAGGMLAQRAAASALRFRS
jgi:cell division protein FtsX